MIDNPVAVIAVCLCILTLGAYVNEMRRSINRCERAMAESVAQIRADRDREIARISEDFQRCQETQQALIEAAVGDTISAVGSGVLATPQQAELFRVMRSGAFGKDDLVAVGYDVGITPDVVDDKTVITIAMSLIQAAAKSGITNDLCKALSRARPDANIRCY